MAINPESTKKVTLWTRQHKNSLKELEADGVIRIKKQHLEEKFDLIADYFIELYDWFVKEANKMVPKPYGVHYPIWCSISEDYMLKPTEDEIVYVIEVEESQVIYFDGSKWDYVLNHAYVPRDYEDAMAYYKYLEDHGFKDPYSFLNKETKQFYPKEAKQVVDSWIRVFDIDNWNYDIFKIQANIWEIRPEMIKTILYE